MSHNKQRESYSSLRDKFHLAHKKHIFYNGIAVVTFALPCLILKYSYLIPNIENVLGSKELSPFQAIFLLLFAAAIATFPMAKEAANDSLLISTLHAGLDIESQASGFSFFSNRLMSITPMDKLLFWFYRVPLIPILLLRASISVGVIYQSQKNPFIFALGIACAFVASASSLFFYKVRLLPYKRLLARIKPSSSAKNA